MSRVFFHVPGKPVPMPRPRVTRFGTYHSKAATSAKAEVVFAWQAAGGVQLDDAPVNLKVAVVVPRPKTHLLASGDLSAVGRRAPVFPKGDVDNYLKLVMDALNGRLWADDVQIVDSVVSKAWERPTMAPGVYVAARPQAALLNALNIARMAEAA